MSRVFTTALLTAFLSAGAAMLTTGPAQAAVDVCQAATPQAGEEIHGPVLFVESGDTLCVAMGETPDRWVRLTLADAPVDNPYRKASNAPANDNPRGTLMAVAFSQNVDCLVQADGRAVCTLKDGRSLGSQLRQPTAWAAGQQWR